MELIIITAAVVAILILITIFATAVFFRYGFARMPDDEYKKSRSKSESFLKRKKDGENWLAKYECRELYATSDDGLRLYARYLPSDTPSEKTIILFHGYRSCAEADFSAMFEYYHSRNYNLLFPDQRSHGKSEGKYITFGALERFDCVNWVNCIINEFGTNQQIVISGLSMGASTVLMSLDLGLPPQVKGVIADCGFTSPRDILTHILHTRFHLPSFPLIYTVAIAAKLFAGFGFGDASTLDSLKSSSLPALIVHGGNDDFVPTEMSVRNYNSSLYQYRNSTNKTPTSELLIIDDAMHAESYLIDKAKYDKTLDSFFEKVWEN